MTEQKPEGTDELGSMIFIDSGVTLEGKPFVTLRWGTETAQLSPYDTRQHALSLLEAAESAESDSLLIRFFRKSGLSLEEIAPILQEWRKMRPGNRTENELADTNVVVP